MKITSVVRMLVPWLLLLAVTSCGTTGYNDFAGGGIGGTGISVGKITASGTGTVDVNGIVFDTSTSVVTLDGRGGGQDKLKRGMVVKITGEFNKDGKTGVAKRIEFKDNLEGPVGQVDPLGTGDTIIVLGQTVIVDSTTYFDDFSDFNVNGTVDVTEFMTQITPGNVVEVSGLVDASGIIHASYISLKSDSFGNDGGEIELKGTITYDLSTGTFTIGGMTIDFSNAGLEAEAVNAANNGLYVEVKSNFAPVNNVLIAFSMEIEDEGHEADVGKRVEVGGFVTDITGIAPDISLTVKGEIVQVNADTIVKKGGVEVSVDNIILNTKVEVKGTVDVNGVLIADEIKIESSDDGSGGDSGADSGNMDNEGAGE